jgi:hypothetical protein
VVNNRNCLRLNVETLTLLVIAALAFPHVIIFLNKKCGDGGAEGSENSFPVGVCMYYTDSRGGA